MKEQSRLKKTSYNVISLLIYQIVVFVCNLILPRLILSNYGSAYNGMVSSITQFLNLVSLLRLGVAGAVRASLYKPLAEKNKEKTSKIVKASQLFMKRIGYIILIYMIILAIIYPTFFGKEFQFLNVAALVIALGLGTFGQYFFGLTYQILLDADQRQYIYNIVQTVTMVLNTFCSTILIISGMSIQGVKFASGILFLVSPILLSRYVIKDYKLDTNCEADDTALAQRKDAMGHSIANIIHENTDMILLTVFTSVKIVSVYSVYALIMNGLKQVLYVFTTGSEAVFGNMWANQEKESISNNLSLFEFIIGVFVSIIFSVTSVLIIPFIMLYTKGVHDVNYIIPEYAFVIVLAQIFYCIRLPYLTITQAAGKYKETKKGAYAEAIINLSVSLVLVNIIGITGTAIGTLVANLFRTIQYMLFTYHHLVKKSIGVFIRRIIWICCNVLIVLMVGKVFVFDYSYHGWMRWIISGVILALLGSIVTLVSSMIFYRKDLFRLFTVLKRMLKR